MALHYSVGIDTQTSSPITAARAGAPACADLERLHQRINSWFESIARDLPWREPDCSAWGVLVS
ncbi:MAG: A/G-specific adenine glycosylase, partial [Actinomycetes bacterium]